MLTEQELQSKIDELSQRKPSNMSEWVAIVHTIRTLQWVLKQTPILPCETWEDKK